MELSVVLAVCLTLSILVTKFFSRKWILFKLKIPDPDRYLLIIEMVYPIVKLAFSLPEERFKVLAGYCKNYPDMMKLWLGPKMIIFVNHPDRIHKVLMSTKCLEKMNLFYGLMERHDGLISASPRRKWKEHRKFFNFSYSLRILESFLPTFITCSDSLVEKICNETEGKEFDFFAHAKKVSFDILCATSLGTNIEEYRKQPIYEKIFDAYET
jgi:Cytochrome P450